MNSNTLFKAVFGGVGALVGSVVGYFIGRHIGRKKGYSEAVERYLEANEGLDDEDVDTEDHEADKAVEEALEKATKKKEVAEELPIDFGDQVEIAEEDITSYTRQKPEKRGKRPYEIDIDTVGTDGYEIKTILYHRQNNAVCDDFDHELPNVNRSIGWSVFNKIDMDETVEHMWVRNEDEQIDYDITVLDDTWDKEGG